MTGDFNAFLATSDVFSSTCNITFPVFLLVREKYLFLNYNLLFDIALISQNKFKCNFEANTLVFGYALVIQNYVLRIRVRKKVEKNVRRYDLQATC